ncbi:MAG: acetate--CoA ligase alpha subunit, partial [Candidatus Woesearchaeota archaeon]
MNLDAIFSPKTIAVVGATSKQGHVGYSLLKNLLSSGFEGTVYPVNPKRQSVQGVKAYACVSDIPDKVDLAIIATPAEAVPGIVDECGKKQVKGIVIISAGFKEAGAIGEQLSRSILEMARLYDMRIIGPNCLGFIRPGLNLNASFAGKMALPGRIAFLSQSGALCTAILDWSVSQNVGFSHFVSVGESLDVGFHDLIDYLGNDPKTNSILIYMESLSDARKFLSAARAFTRTKPIIVLKVGKSAEGARAALSHTGSVAGNDAIFDAAFKRAGIIRVETIEDLFDCAKTLAMQKKPSGNRLAIVTNAGGPGVIATDSLVSLGGQLAKLSPDTMKKLNDCLPANWSRQNPVDVLGDADSRRYSKAVELCLLDESVDGVVVILTPQSMTDAADVARTITDIPNTDQKTLLAAWMGAGDVQEGRHILEKHSIPSYSRPESAVRCFMFMHSYSKNLELLYETPATIPHAFDPDTEANKKLIAEVSSSGRFVLNEHESKQLLKNYGIPVARNALASNPKDAADIAGKIGFPVAMKISSPDIMHKTNVGGVRIGVNSREEAFQAYRSIIRSARKHAPKARIEGVFIEQVMSKRHELLIGCKKDPIFGPAIVFGMGGVAVEIFKDINVGLPPLNMALAMRLIEGTRIYDLLKGYRNMPAVNIKSIQFLLYKFAYLVMDFPEIKEIDINPLGVDEKGAVVLDAKVLLDEEVIKKGLRPHEHMVISPYPKEYVSKFTLRNGNQMVLRPIRPEDEPLEAEMFTKFSERTQRYRFFTLLKDITHELLVRYT